MKLAITYFTLSWIHSAQKTEWRESWTVTEDGLQIREAMIKGSGAGMEPGPDALLHDGWWVWHPSLPKQRRIVLAASGATPSAWQLCYRYGCLNIGKSAGTAVVLEACGQSKDEK